jgi:hypothetical protein
MRLPRTSTEWQQKFRQFLDITFGGTSRGGTAPCPCPRCVCMSYRPQSEVQLHVLARGFAKDARNIRLGLASDGFNPFGMQNVTYTTWPVILIPYNLPPWLLEK